MYSHFHIIVSVLMSPKILTLNVVALVCIFSMSRVFSHHFSEEHPEVHMMLFVDGGYHRGMLGKCLMNGSENNSPEVAPYAGKHMSCRTILV